MALNRNLRDDLKYAPYAVALGYSIHHDHGEPLDHKRFIAGIDHNAHTFHRNFDQVRIWLTSRGWRLAVVRDEMFVNPPLDREFFRDLKDALEAGVKIDPKTYRTEEAK